MKIRPRPPQQMNAQTVQPPLPAQNPTAPQTQAITTTAQVLATLAPQKAQAQDTVKAVQTRPQELPAHSQPDAPAYIKPSGEGLENAGDEGLMLPMLKIAQPLTETVVSQQLRPGDVFLHVSPTEALFNAGQEVNVIPFFHFKQWIEWAPRDEGGGMIARSIDPAGELAARSARGETRGEGDDAELAVTEYHVFFVVFEGNLTEPVALPMARTQHKKGRLLLSLALRRGPRFPLYAGKYSLSTFLDHNKTGQQFYNYEVKNAGWASKEEYEACEKLYRDSKNSFDKVMLPVDNEATVVVDEKEAAEKTASY